MMCIYLAVHHSSRWATTSCLSTFGIPYLILKNLGMKYVYAAKAHHWCSEYYKMIYCVLPRVQMTAHALTSLWHGENLSGVSPVSSDVPRTVYWIALNFTAMLRSITGQSTTLSNFQDRSHFCDSGLLHTSTSVNIGTRNDLGYTIQHVYVFSTTCLWELTLHKKYVVALGSFGNRQCDPFMLIAITLSVLLIKLLFVSPQVVFFLPWVASLIFISISFAGHMTLKCRPRMSRCPRELR